MVCSSDQITCTVEDLDFKFVYKFDKSIIFFLIRQAINLKLVSRLITSTSRQFLSAAYLSNISSYQTFNQIKYILKFSTSVQTHFKIFKNFNKFKHLYSPKFQ